MDKDVSYLGLVHTSPEEFENATITGHFSLLRSRY